MQTWKRGLIFQGDEGVPARTPRHQGKILKAGRSNSECRDRNPELREGDIACAFLAKVLEQARMYYLLSDEHVTVDGTLIEAWAGQKSF